MRIRWIGIALLTLAPVLTERHLPSIRSTQPRDFAAVLSSYSPSRFGVSPAGLLVEASAFGRWFRRESLVGPLLLLALLRSTSVLDPLPVHGENRTY